MALNKNNSSSLHLSGELRQGQFKHGEHDPCSRPKVLENFQLLGCLKNSNLAAEAAVSLTSEGGRSHLTVDVLETLHLH